MRSGFPGGGARGTAPMPMRLMRRWSGSGSRFRGAGCAAAEPSAVRGCGGDAIGGTAAGPPGITCVVAQPDDGAGQPGTIGVAPHVGEGSGSFSEAGLREGFWSRARAKRIFYRMPIKLSTNLVTNAITAEVDPRAPLQFVRGKVALFRRRRSASPTRSVPDGPPSRADDLHKRFVKYFI